MGRFAVRADVLPDIALGLRGVHRLIRFAAGGGHELGHLHPARRRADGVERRAGFFVHVIPARKKRSPMTRHPGKSAQDMKKNGLVENILGLPQTSASSNGRGVMT